MENAQAIKLAGRYVALWVGAGLLGAGIAVAGVALGGLAVVGMYPYTPFALRLATVPSAGFALILLGGLVWKFGSVAAYLTTFSGAVEAQTAAQLDTEAMKSDILSVLDDRLADIHEEVNGTRRLVNRLSRDDAASEFEFREEVGDD